MTIPVGFFELKSAAIHHLRTHIDAGNYQAKCPATFLYDDLKIDVLKPDEEEPDKVKKRGLVSFFAKTFILKQSNPSKGKPASVRHVRAERYPFKSFFNLIWIIIRTGLIDTVKGK